MFSQFHASRVFAFLRNISAGYAPLPARSSGWKNHRRLAIAEWTRIIDDGISKDRLQMKNRIFCCDLLSILEILAMLMSATC